MSQNISYEKSNNICNENIDNDNVDGNIDSDSYNIDVNVDSDNIDGNVNSDNVDGNIISHNDNNTTESIDKKKLKNLVLGGGGQKLICYAGLVEYLCENNLLDDIKVIVGTSAGAIAALMIACKYNKENMMDIMNKWNALDIHNIKFNNIINFMNNHYFDDGVNLEILIKTILELKGINPYINLINFYKLNGIKLVFCTCNLTLRDTEFISYENHPTMPIWMAVRASCSLPFIFKYVKYKKNCYIDGGAHMVALDYFPDSELDESACFLFVDPLKKYVGDDGSIKSISNYIYSMIRSFHGQKISYLKKYKEYYSIIDCNISILVINNISDEQKKEAIQCGYNTSKEHFEKRGFV